MDWLQATRKRVQGERVDVRSGALLLDEAAENSDFGGVGLHGGKAIAPLPTGGCRLPCSGVSVYARILRTPGVAVLVLATLVGRLPIGISGLAILLYVREVTGSFAAAGLCTGALALGSAAGAPLQGRLVDRRGEGMLLPLAAAHAAGLLLVWALGAAGAPAGVIAMAALLAGAAIPPLTSVLRSRWPYLLEARPRLIPSAFALDSVLIEIIFVIGPLVTTAIVATVGAQYALVVSAACVLSGTALLLTGLRGRSGPERGQADGRVLGLGALAAPGLRTLVLASLPWASARAPSRSCSPPSASSRAPRS